MNEMTAEQKEAIRNAQRQYNKDYYQKNKEKLLERKREWRKQNPEKARQSVKNYWLRKALEQQQNN